MEIKITRINERFIQLRGKAIVEEDHKLGEDIIVKCTITDITENDRTFN